MKLIYLVILLFCAPMTAVAAPIVEWGIDWTGKNGYTMDGRLHLEGDFIKRLTIQGYRYGQRVGRYNWVLGDNLNLNFSARNGGFAVGGRSDSRFGQAWNVPTVTGGVGFGFFAGNTTEGLIVNGEFISDSLLFTGSTVPVEGLDESGLRARLLAVDFGRFGRVNLRSQNFVLPNPEPGTLAFLGIGLGSMLLYRRLRT